MRPAKLSTQKFARLFLPLMTSLVFAVAVAAECAEVSGQVYALHTKEPVSGVTVVLKPVYDPLPYHEAPPVSLECVSGADGAFSFAGIAPGSYRLMAQGAGVGLSQIHLVEVLRDSGALGPFPIYTVPGGGIRGRVYDRNSGSGLANKQVDAYSPGTSRTFKAVTDSDGKYAFENLPPGFCSVELYWERNPQNNVKRRVYIRDGQQIANLDFPLGVQVPRAGIISGQVANPAGAPVAGANIRVLDAKPHLWPWWRTETDRAGCFTLSDLNPDKTFRLEVIKDGFAVRYVEAQPSAEDILTIELRPEAVLTGVVRDATGQPLEGAQVHARQVEGLLHHNDMTKKDGSFRIGCLPAGTYAVHTGLQPMYSTFSSSIPVFFPSDENRVGTYTLAEGQTLAELELPLIADIYEWSEISGVVVNAQGHPVAGARVSAENARFAGSAITGEDGAFAIPRLPSGRYRLNVAARGYVRRLGGEHGDWRSYQDEVETGDKPVRLVLEKTGRIEGRIVDTNTGAPIPVYEIEFAYGPMVRPDSSSSMRRTYLEPEGRFSLEVDTRAKYVVARAEGFAPKSKAIRVGPDENLRDIVLALSPAPVFEGRTLDPDGAPLPFAHLYFPFGDDEREFHFAEEVDIFLSSDAQGGIVLDHFAPGSYRIGCFSPGFLRAQQTIEVKPDQGGTVEWRVRHGGKISGRFTYAGKPVADTRIELRNNRAGVMFNRETFTDANGEYVFAALPSGSFSLSAWHSINEPLYQGWGVGRNVSLHENEHVEVSLAAATGDAALELAVLLPQARVLKAPDISVWIKLPDGGVRASIPPQSGEPLLIEALPAGALRLEVSYSTMTKHYDVELASGETRRVEIDFSTVSTLEGKVIGRKPGQDITVFAFLEKMGWLLMWMLGDLELFSMRPGIVHTWLGDSPEYTLSVEEPGKYAVVAVPYDSENFQDFLQKIRYRNVNVTPGENYRVDFNLMD